MPEATSRDGTRISFDSKGQGPAVILVAGAMQYRAVESVTPLLAGTDHVAQALPDATRLTLEDQSHQYDPKVLAPALASFFAR